MKRKCIPLNEVQKKKTNYFSIGFANSMFQASGEVCGESNWTDAGHKQSVPRNIVAQPHWDNFEADLDLMMTTGIDAYRISVEWSHIEPIKNEYDLNVLARYHKLMDACIKRNITPMITLYHFNEPLWFTELGSFEREENIQYYISFCKYVFSEFSPKVSQWCTMNEPGVQAFSGYLYGQFPPHKNNLLLTVTVLKNLLKAHVDVYHELKSLPHGEQAMIGIVHNILRFKSLYPFDLLSYTITSSITTITDDLVIQFFKTGRFDYYSLLAGIDIHYQDLRASNANDFFGLNFYANPVIGPNLTNAYGPTCYFGQEMGDMYLPLDPKGLADALDEAAQLGKPIYITETGIADRTDKLRQKFITQYCKVIRDKIALGVDIRKLFFWSFKDNYEWNEGGPVGEGRKLFGFFTATGEPRESVDVLKKLTREGLNTFVMTW